MNPGLQEYLATDFQEVVPFKRSNLELEISGGGPQVIGLHCGRLPATPENKDGMRISTTSNKSFKRQLNSGVCGGGATVGRNVSKPVGPIACIVQEEFS